MTVPVISHSHEGIRVNIDGVVDVFGNAVQVAESYARHKVNCRNLAEMARPLAEKLMRHSDWIRNLSPTSTGALELTESQAVQLQEGFTDDISSLGLVLHQLMEHCTR